MVPKSGLWPLQPNGYKVLWILWQGEANPAKEAVMGTGLLEPKKNATKTTDFLLFLFFTVPMCGYFVMGSDFTTNPK